jgi:hypothetical protein
MTKRIFAGLLHRFCFLPLSNDHLISQVLLAIPKYQPASEVLVPKAPSSTQRFVNYLISLILRQEPTLPALHKIVAFRSTPHSFGIFLSRNLFLPAHQYVHVTTKFSFAGIRQNIPVVYISRTFLFTFSTSLMSKLSRFAHNRNCCHTAIGG